MAAMPITIPVHMRTDSFFLKENTRANGRKHNCSAVYKREENNPRYICHKYKIQLVSKHNA